MGVTGQVEAGRADAPNRTRWVLVAGASLAILWAASRFFDLRGALADGEWALYVVGLGATIVLTVFVTRLARRALEEAPHEASPDPGTSSATRVL